MKASWLLLVPAILLAAACSGSIKRAEDTGEDTTPDVVDEDTSTDVPSEPDVEDLADTGVDTGEDPDVVEVMDVPDSTDLIEDEVIDTIGMPCTSDEECGNGVYCDGMEYCHPAGECRRSPAIDCGDGNGCTTDSCNETTDSCDNVLIDGDGDGYPPESCGGNDCNDTDVSIHPDATDPCGDGIDQDCDGADSTSGTCDCPIDLTVPSTPTGDTTGYGSTTTGSCDWSSGAPEVVYRLVLTATTSLRVWLDAPGWYGMFYLRQGTCDGTEVLCGLDYNGAVTRTLTAGTYYLFVDGASSTDDGAYTLHVETYTPPTPVTGNDTCGSAHAITSNGSYSGDNTALLDDAEPVTCATSSHLLGGHDAWFSFTTGTTATITLTTAGSVYDTVLYVRQGTCTGTEVGCNDDVASGDTTSRVVLTSLAAGTYYIVVDAYRGTNVGTYVLNVSGLP